jgi:hypothetical protein
MTRAMSSGVWSNIRKIAVAGMLVAIPTAVVSISAYAAPGFDGTPNTPAVLPVPPADPPTDAPQPPPPPPPPPPPAQSPGDQYPSDWWPYAGTGSF